MNETKIQVKRVGNGFIVSRNFNEEVRMVLDGPGCLQNLLQVVADMLWGFYEDKHGEFMAAPTSESRPHVVIANWSKTVCGGTGE